MMERRRFYVLLIVLVVLLGTALFNLKKFSPAMEELEESRNNPVSEEQVMEEDTLSGIVKYERAIQKIIDYGREGNLQKLAQMVQYPLMRSYPLPLIRDSADFVNYAGIIWDDSLKQVFRNLRLEDWSLFGWHGFSFADGHYLWVGEKKISDITYDSKRELELKERLFKEDIAMLHPSLQEGIQETWLTIKDVKGTFYGRLDLMKNKKYRLSLYDKAQKKSERPFFVAMDSIWNQEGSMANTYLVFVKGGVTIKILHSYYYPTVMYYIEKGDTTQYELDCDNYYVTVSDLKKKGYLR